MSLQDSFFSEQEMSDMFSGVVPPAPKDYVLPTAFPSLKHAARISWDLETCDPKIGEYGNGVYRKDGYIVGGAIAAWDRDKKLFHAEYYPMRHRGGPNLDPDKVIAYFQDSLNFFEGELTGANVGLYDGDWGQSVGIRPLFAKWRDIQWAEPLIDEMAFNYKLGTLGQKYLRRGKVTNELERLYGPDYIKRFQEVHPGHARAYGLGDVLLPNDILDCQYIELKALGLLELYELECRLTPFLLYLREQGVRVDMDRALRFKNVLEEKRAAALRVASEACGVEISVENFGNKRLLQHVFNKLGIPIPFSKKDKSPSITDKWLEHLAHPIGKALLAANKYDKAKETFVDSYIFDYAVGGRIHGDFHPLRKADADEEAGTESGRFSGSNPNLQNIPARDEEIGPMCRSMFVPEPGGEWWAWDYSQIEYRFLTHYATLLPPIKGVSEAAERRRKAIEAALATKRMYEADPDTDFHQAVSDLTGLKRKDAKNLNFGLVYGMGVPLLAKNLNLVDEQGKPKQEALDIMELYHGKAPFIKELYNLCSAGALETGEVRTILNRRSQFEMYEPNRIAKGEKQKPALPLNMAIEAYGFDIRRAYTHKALNRKLQGSAADKMKKAMVLLWESGIFTSTKDFTCSLTVHDELDGTIFPTKRGKECYDEGKHIMETAIPLNVPVLVGAGIGADWSEAK